MKRLIAMICALILGALCLTSCGGGKASGNTIPTTPPEERYAKALECLENGDYEQAHQLFYGLRDYKDSKEYLGRFAIVCQTASMKRGHPILMKLGIGETHTVHLSFDEHGNLLTEDTYRVRDGVTENAHVYEYEYDDAGRIVTIKCTNPDGKVETTTYVYGSDGKVTQKATEYTNGWSGEWQYNEDGHLVKESQVDSEGNSTLWEGTYDESGRLVKEVESNQYWGEVSVTVTEYVYSEDGKTVTKTERDGEGNVTDTETEDLSEEDADDMESEDEYQYDPETGVPISRTTVYENGGYRVVEFYPTGVVMRCTVYSEEDEVEAVYAYDEYGKEIMFEGTSFSSIKQTYQYDENGNKIKEYYEERDTLMYVATYSEFIYFYYPDGLPEVQQNYYPDLGGIDRAQYNLGWENSLNAD